MKHILFTAALLLAAQGLMSTSGCNKNDRKTNCTGEEICTMIFAAVNVTVKDGAGQPVVLDEHYTIRKSTNETITSGSDFPENGSYTVLDDSYRQKLAGQTDEFTFVGKKNGQEIVREVYSISADCCHISRQSGKTEVVVP